MGTGRVDNSYTWMDPVLVAGPWVLVGWLLSRAGRAAAKRFAVNGRADRV